MVESACLSIFLGVFTSVCRSVYKIVVLCHSALRGINSHLGFRVKKGF